MAKENGITIVYKDGVKHTFYDLDYANTSNLSSGSSSNSVVVRVEEDNFWKQAQTIFFALKDPNLNKVL